MKNLITCLLLLIIFGCNPSDDELQLQDELQVQNEITESEFNKMIDMIQTENAKLNETDSTYDKSSSKNTNNGNGIYFVPIYSDDVRPWAIWYIAWPIPNSDLTMIVDFPQNGDDRALVFSENEFMANYTIQGPRVFIVKNGVGIVYSNFCEENKTGIYSMRQKAEYLAIDQDEDGETDIYLWGQSWQKTDKNGRMHLKTTLTDAHSFSGDCPIPNEEVDFSFTLQSQNGRPRVEAVLDGVKYSL